MYAHIHSLAHVDMCTYAHTCGNTTHTHTCIRARRRPPTYAYANVHRFAHPHTCVHILARTLAFNESRMGCPPARAHTYTDLQESATSIPWHYQCKHAPQSRLAQLTCLGCHASQQAAADLHQHRTCLLCHKSLASNIHVDVSTCMQGSVTRTLVSLWLLKQQRITCAVNHLPTLSTCAWDTLM